MPGLARGYDIDECYVAQRLVECKCVDANRLGAPIAHDLFRARFSFLRPPSEPKAPYDMVPISFAQSCRPTRLIGRAQRNEG